MSRFSTRGTHLQPDADADAFRHFKPTFHYYRDFEKSPLPELLTRIKIDLKRLFVTVIKR